MGGTLHIPSVEYFDPPLVLEEIREKEFTWINCTPGMFYKLVEDETQLYKLSSLRYVFLGGEPISLPMLSKWFASAECRGELVNTYGPTECTDVCSFYRFGEGGLSSSGVVPIGRAVYNTRLYVLDRHLRPVPTGVSGELCISGDGVGPGYINHGEMTSEKFVTVSLDGGTSELLYRTGDLARRLEDGNIEFNGRMDQQVKVRGFRIELGEIENLLVRYDGVKEAVVIVPGSEREGNHLSAYFVPENPGDVDVKIPAGSELKEYLSQHLPGYMIPTYFTRLERIPLSVNGKIDRRVLPEPELKAGEEFVGPRNDIEYKLVELWSEVLEIKKELISIDGNFFELGGHSLKAAVMTARIHKEMNVRVPLSELFKTPAIRGLARAMVGKTEEEYTSIQPVEKKEYYPLSSVQHRMYVAQQMKLESKSYNMPIVVVIKEKLDNERLTDVFTQLIRRHESLRTSFVMVNSHAVQKISDKTAFEIEYHEVPRRDETPGSSTEIEEIVSNFIRTFDLAAPPLFRVGVIETGEKEYLLMADMHHIISDGISLEILVNDFTALYTGKELPPLTIQYKDFAEWQNRLVRSGRMDKQKEYWLGRFEKGNIPVSNMPLDYPRPAVRDIEAGDFIEFSLDRQLSKALYGAAAEAGTTLYMMMLAAYYVLLARYTRQEDIVVGSLISGRSHADLENVIGVFVNTLPLRNFPGAEKTFARLLSEVKESAVHANENQDYQFEELVRELGLQGESGRNPLFDTVFTMDTLEAAEVKKSDLKVELYEGEGGIKFAKFDLYFQVTDTGETIRILLRYSTQLFKPSTIEKIKKYYTEILEQVVDGMDVKLEDIALSHDFITVTSAARKNAGDGFNF